MKRVTCFTYVVNLTFTTGPWENAAPKVGQFVQPPEVNEWEFSSSQV